MQLFTQFVAIAAAAAPLFTCADAFALRSTNDIIPGKWLIQLKPETDIASIASHHNKVRNIHARNLGRRNGDGPVGGGMERSFHFGNFKAYAGSFDDRTIEELKAMPEVLVVEQDYIMTTSALVTQEDAPWGLARISSRIKGATDYVYDGSAGEGTYSYVVDTGIFTAHTDFGGRAVFGANLVPNSTVNADNNGHGTHVAGIIGSTTYGVAKKTTLVAVKVFEYSTGSASTVIAGFQWAVKDIVSKGREKSAVINMSLGGRGSETWDAAVSAAWEQGVLAVVAAGNENQLASNTSPCRSVEALCVGNAQIDDSRFPGASGSNYGDAVDIWAAGTNITSTYPSWSGALDATTRLTGTSMASPHVAGLVSYLRGFEGAASAKDIRASVLALATPLVVSDTMGAANLMAFNGAQQKSVNGTNRLLGSGGLLRSIRHGQRSVRMA